MCLLCPDNPLMNASRHTVELVGDELEQAEPAEALTLEPPELLEELPDLAEALPELLEEPPELLEEPPAALLLAAVTWIEKAGSAVMVVPSLAVMTMLGYWPASGSVGVPESTPVVSPKVAQMGIFRMPKLRGVPLGFSTVG